MEQSLFSRNRCRRQPNDFSTVINFNDGVIACLTRGKLLLRVKPISKNTLELENRQFAQSLTLFKRMNNARNSR